MTTTKPNRLVWRRFHMDELPKPGELIIVNLETGTTFCKVIRIGAHWSDQPRGWSGYWVLLQEFPNGKDLVREYEKQLWEEMQKEYYESK